MARVKTFADTSSVTLAYGITDAADANTVALAKLNYIPYTQEGFTLSKESAESAAIRQNRRSKGRKNTRGTTSGSAGLEFGVTPFIEDMLALSAMSEWKDVTEADAPTGAKFLIDGSTPRFFLVEKRIKAVRSGAKHNDFRRFYGNLVNEASIEVSEDLVGFTVNTMAAFADIFTAEAEASEDAGGLASTYEAPEDYEIADASNNVKNAVIRDSDGNPLELTFGDFTISISNNVREQRGVGNEFAAGMGMGKVAVSVSGTAYYFDNTLLETHLTNKFVSFECDIVTSEGTYKFKVPYGKVGPTEDSAGGENQDFTSTLQIDGEEGTVTIGDVDYPCAFSFVKEA